MKRPASPAVSIGRLKAPSTVFTRCPHCGSPNITKSSGHVYCRFKECLWDSVETYEQLAVEMFGFDLGKLDLERAFLHFQQPQTN